MSSFCRGTTRWLQCDQPLPLSVKSVACKTKSLYETNHNQFTNVQQQHILITQQSLIILLILAIEENQEQVTGYC